MTSFALSIGQRLASAFRTSRCSAITFFADAMVFAFSPPDETLVFGCNFDDRLAIGIPYFAVGVLMTTYFLALRSYHSLSTHTTRGGRPVSSI